MNPKLTIIKKAKRKGEDGFSTFSIRIPEQLKDRINVLAQQSDLSRNAMITRMLEYGCQMIEIIEEAAPDK
jgi:predicted transcriptional regulator